MLANAHAVLANELATRAFPATPPAPAVAASLIFALGNADVGRFFATTVDKVRPVQPLDVCIQVKGGRLGVNRNDVRLFHHVRGGGIFADLCALSCTRADQETRCQEP